MLIKPHILISASTHKAKCYPYWGELVAILTKNNYLCTQLGEKDQYKIPGCAYVWDKSLKEVEDLVKSVGDFIAIDNFLHHLAHQVGVRGTVIWGPSDPRLFGYGDQINIIKDYKYLRKDQYGFYRDFVWEHAKEGWYGAKEVWEFFTDEQTSKGSPRSD